MNKKNRVSDDVDLNVSQFASGV